MQVWDRQHGAVHGLSIAPTANVSADQTGAGVDLGTGTLVGHATVHATQLTDDLVVHIQQSDDDVAGDYADTDTITIAPDAGDGGTEGLAPRCYQFQFFRKARWARVKVVVGSNANIRLSASLESQLQSGGGGSSTSPAS